MRWKVLHRHWGSCWGMAAAPSDGPDGSIPSWRCSVLPCTSAFPLGIGVIKPDTALCFLGFLSSLLLRGKFQSCSSGAGTGFKPRVTP